MTGSRSAYGTALSGADIAVAIADTEATHHIKRLNGLDSQDVYLRLTAIRSAEHRVLRARKE